MTQQTTSIRILEKDNNRRGDLFGRLMADLFVALGYDQPRLNVHKSGRELDLQADHRLEPRRAIGECKATSESIGGDDLNKFVGVLDAEHEDKRPTTGYFISLAGFKETAVEQERKRRRTKIVTLTGQQVVDELIKGRILVAKERATELAGRCCTNHQNLVLDPNSDLLAHERGWIWAVYYTQGKERTHTALIHSDGTPLARALADDVIAADRQCGGELHSLSCLNPPPQPGADTDVQVKEALAAYGQYLANECGYIQLDGLPADSDVGSRRLRLENLFVPLHLDVATKQKDEKEERKPVGEVLSDHPRLALLAAPGGGKSTLVKRLAVAYSDSARLGQVSDDLPKRDWLPLFFRCRELRSLTRGSFAELIEAVSQREPVRQYAAAFRTYVDRALLAGRVLLLVDGLDEISDPGDRAAFVCTLRAALQAYPKIAIVVTSRESGFRHVAAHLAPVCTHATLSPFDADDISRLSVAWHREVVGDTEKVRLDAEQLAATIVDNDRIRRLAVNPLLLTTLLLVKRWVGALPTRRAVLYGKAVELLLMTWNTEGHDPIPEEEAMPQLCYVASSMMLGGVQKISRPSLATLLQQARTALPTELGYVKEPVDQFIQRVEDRSSLLMMTGHDVEDGRLVEFFEFRHLTFQEFLTAQAMVKGWHPGHEEKDTLASVLEPHFSKEEWREIIPLAAVLGGKATDGLIQRLTKEIRGAKRATPSEDPIASVLIDCLADEAAARPETIRAALRKLVLTGPLRQVRALIRGRYGADLRTEAERAFFTMKRGGLDDSVMETLATITYEAATSEDPTKPAGTVAQFLEMLKSTEALSRCEGALGLMHLCFQLKDPDKSAARQECADVLRRAAAAMIPMLLSADPREQYASSWALAWLGECRVWAPPADPDILDRLWTLWQSSPVEEVRKQAVSALGCQTIDMRHRGDRLASVRPADFEQILKRYDQMIDMTEKPASLIVAWYRNLLPAAEIAKRAETLLHSSLKTLPSSQNFRDLLDHLKQQPKS
jgi:hypothetical protein